MAVALSWALSDAEGRVTSLIRSVITPATYEFATHRRAGVQADADRCKRGPAADREGEAAEHEQFEYAPDLAEADRDDHLISFGDEANAGVAAGDPGARPRQTAPTRSTF